MEKVLGLRSFYAWQAQSRLDWRIHVQETVEVGGLLDASGRQGA